MKGKDTYFIEDGKFYTRVRGNRIDRLRSFFLLEESKKEGRKPVLVADLSLSVTFDDAYVLFNAYGPSGLLAFTYTARPIHKDGSFLPPPTKDGLIVRPNTAPRPVSIKQPRR